MGAFVHLPHQDNLYFKQTRPKKISEVPEIMGIMVNLSPLYQSKIKFDIKY